MSSHDDDFDDLFSFSVATPTTPTSTSTTGHNNQLQPESATTTRKDTDTGNNTSATSGDGNTIASSDLDSSYCKISSPKNNNGNNNDIIENDDDDDDDDVDDIFGEFNLETIQSKSNANKMIMTKEEDFNGMDEGTREFLDFLENDSGGQTTALLTTKDVMKDIFGDNDDLTEFDNNNNNNKYHKKSDNILASLNDDSSSSSSDNDDDDNIYSNKGNSGNHAPSLLEEKRKVDIQSNQDNENQGEEEELAAGFVTINSIELNVTTTKTTNTGNSVNIMDIENSTPPTMADSTLALNNDSKVDSAINADTLLIETIETSDTHVQNNNDVTTEMINVSSSTKSDKNLNSNSRTNIVMTAPIQKDAAQSASNSTSLGSELTSNLERQDNSSKSSTSTLSPVTSVNDDANQKQLNLSSNKDITQNNDEKGKKDNNSISGETVSMSFVEKIEEVKDITFHSLTDALQSSESKLHHIRSFIYNKQNHSQSNTTNAERSFIASISKENRPYLWSKVICGKVLNDVQSSSLVDSFMTWNESVFDYEKFVSRKEMYDIQDELFIQRIVNEVNVLATRVINGIKARGNDSLNSNFHLDHDDDINWNNAKRDLCSLLVFYYRSTSNIGSKKVNSFASILKGDHNNVDSDSKKSNDNIDSNSSVENYDDVIKVDKSNDEKGKEHNISQDMKQSSQDNKQVDEKTESRNIAQTEASENAMLKNQKIEINPFIGPIATTLLAASIPIEVASVMLSKIISTLPLISLTTFERLTAVKSLHQQFYFLVCYHLPLLVLHLDKYAPGWHWPRICKESEENDEEDLNSPTNKSRNLQANGTIPMAWFASLLSGEGTNVTLDQVRLLPLWDVLLTCDDQSLKFFLALAMLEKHSDSLMMLRGKELIHELSAVMALKPSSDVEDDTFVQHQFGISSQSNDDAAFVLNWYHDAKILQDSTPSSVMLNLRKAEDKAVNHILTVRSKVAMEKMKERLEAEAEAHRKSVEEENCRQAEERLYKYYKKRLETFYEKNCPEKKGSVDTILKCYKDRYPLLDEKLRKKYGSGFLPFLPVLNPQLANQTNKFISNVGQGIESRKKNLVASRAKERASKLDEDMIGPGAYQVAIKVSASEIMPVVCGSKTSNGSLDQLKFYLVDSRPKETIKIQGAFPTAVNLCPEDLMDPDCIQEKVEMFESLRGGVHICIMGEGFSSFPTLYDHPLNQIEEKLLKNDESRTNMCALFFIKKGFPFISVLDGGFAAAHAWLARDCDYLSLTEVLIDYDGEASLFADLERAYQTQKEFTNASTRRKTTLALQKIIDNSMTRITLLEKGIEEFTDRPRGKSKKEVQEVSNSPDIAVWKDVDSDGNKSNLKIPPMKIFMKQDSSTKKESDRVAKKDKSETDSTDNGNNNNFKVGLNKAFSGLKNMRVQRGAEKDKKSNDVIHNDSKVKEETQPHVHAFKFSNINFSRKSNIFAKKPNSISKRDDDLEKEIEASLTKPVEADTTQKDADNKWTNDGIKSQGNPFKKINLNKFSSISRPTRQSSNSIIREEESLFFDEESLDDTADFSTSHSG